VWVRKAVGTTRIKDRATVKKAIQSELSSVSKNAECDITFSHHMNVKLSGQSVRSQRVEMENSPVAATGTIMKRAKLAITGIRQNGSFRFMP